jgi:hypothetical protein
MLFIEVSMDKITDKSIQREAKALNMCYNFNAYEFCELAAKFEYDAGYSKEDAERLALQCIRERYRP